MSRIEFITEEEIASRVLQEQADPLSMAIVVLKEQQSLKAICMDVVNGVRSAQDKFMESDIFGDGYQEWLDLSFRKVTLRAKKAQLERLVVEGAVESGLTAICPPQRKTDRWPLLNKLQALSAPIHLDDIPDDTVIAPGTLLIRKSLGMGQGKILAQIGHASLMNSGAAITQIRYADDAEWEEAAGRFTVGCVRDAGITEVDPGSETIMVVVSEEFGWQQVRCA